MNNDLLKRYIDDQPTKIVTKLDFATGKLSYDKIVQCQKRTDAKPDAYCEAKRPSLRSKTAAFRF